MEQKNPIQVADRLFGALEYLGEEGAKSLMEVSAALGLNKSTAHRILMSLEYMGYVRQNPEDLKYELTFKIVGLSTRLVERTDIIMLVRPYLRELMEITGETVHFVRKDGVDAVYIDKVDSRENTIQMVSRIGSRIPLYRSGVGKAMAADMTEEEIREIWDHSEVVKVTPYTITDYEDFLFTVDSIRKRGFALDNEENENGVRCVAASLHIPNHPEHYAFSISAPVTRMDNERITELAREILKTREKIMKEFGHEGR